MSNTFLDSQTLPEYFYRVQYKGCQTKFDRRTGLQARSLSPVNFLSSSCTEIVDEHLHWAKTQSPFISLFSDLPHARHWAAKFSKREVQLLTIRTADMLGSVIFKVSDVFQQIGISDEEQSRYGHEYLCFYRVEPQAVVSVRDFQGIRDDFANGVKIAPPLRADIATEDLLEELASLGI